MPRDHKTLGEMERAAERGLSSQQSSSYKSQSTGFSYSNSTHYIMKQFDLKLKEGDDNNFADY